jgi:hypothetical protein
LIGDFFGTHERDGPKSAAIGDMALENTSASPACRPARSSRVHRQAAGRDYAAPLQLNGNG